MTMPVGAGGLDQALDLPPSVRYSRARTVELGRLRGGRDATAPKTVLGATSRRFDFPIGFIAFPDLLRLK
jgi:hypothetical protein